MPHLLLVLIFCTNFELDNTSQPDSLWTLEKCVEYAIVHNSSIKRQKLNVDLKEVVLSEKEWAYSPTFKINGNSAVSNGRVLDQTTYEFIKNSTVVSSSASLVGSVDLFHGLTKHYALQRAKIDLEESKITLSSQECAITKQVIASFLSLKCCELDIASAIKTKELLTSQVEKIQLMVKAGRVTESDLLFAQSQLFAAENDIKTAEGNKEMTKLELCQILGINDYNSFVTADIPIISYVPAISISDNRIYSRPEIMAAKLEVAMAEKDISLAKSSYFPSFSLSLSLASNSSSARQKVFQTTDGLIRYENYPLRDQYIDNANSFVSVGVSIPIFSGMQISNNIKRAKINYNNAELNLLEATKSITKEVRQLEIDCQTSYKKYLLAQEQLKYAEEAELQMRERYNLGTADFITWNTAATELAKARYNYSEALYKYMYNVKVLELY